MARSLDSSVVAQLTQPGIRLVHLLKLQTSTSILTTTHVKDLVYDSGSGNETYYAGGNLIELETVRESGDMEYQNLNISLNNISTTTRDMFKSENYVNKAVDIYIAFLDSSESIIEAYKWFSGSLAHAVLTEAKGEYKVKLELANQWKNWDIIQGRKYTDTSQQDLYSGDKGLSFAHTTNEDIRWNR